MRRTLGWVLGATLVVATVTTCEQLGTNPLALQLQQWYGPTIRLQITGGGVAAVMHGPGTVDLGTVATNTGGMFTFSFTNAGSDAVGGLQITDVSYVLDANTIVQGVSPQNAVGSPVDSFPAAQAGGTFVMYPADGETLTIAFTVESNDAADGVAVFDISITGDAALNDPETTVQPGAAGGPRMTLQSWSVAGIPDHVFTVAPTFYPRVAALRNGQSETITLTFKNTGDTALMLANEFGSDPFTAQDAGGPANDTSGTVTFTYPDSAEPGEVFDVDMTYTNDTSEVDDITGGEGDTFEIIPNTYAGSQSHWFYIVFLRTGNTAKALGVPLVDGEFVVGTTQLGDVSVGQSKDTTVELLNVGEANLAVSSVGVDDAVNYSVNSTAGDPTLGPGEALARTLTFAPATADPDLEMQVNFDVDVPYPADLIPVGFTGNGVP